MTTDISNVEKIADLSAAGAGRLSSLAASFSCLKFIFAAQAEPVTTLISLVIGQCHLFDPEFAGHREEHGAEWSDAMAAGGFIVWLYIYGFELAGREVGTSFDGPALNTIDDVFDAFDFAFVARFGSTETRAVIAAWLQDPWFPEVGGLTGGAAVSPVAGGPRPRLRLVHSKRTSTRRAP